MLSINQINTRGKYLQDAIDRIHEDKPCENNIDSMWCSRCFHMKERIEDFVDTLPKWLAILMLISHFIVHPIFSIKYMFGIWTCISK